MNLDQKIINKYSILVKKAKLGKTKTTRKNSINETCRYLFLEGKILIDEAIKASNLRGCIEIDKIFHTSNELVNKNIYFLNNNPIKINDHILNLWSNVKTSQGIIGNFIFFKL